jgi:hypothetical protein
MVIIGLTPMVNRQGISLLARCKNAVSQGELLKQSPVAYFGEVSRSERRQFDRAADIGEHSELLLNLFKELSCEQEIMAITRQAGLKKFAV